ncbi:PTS lactose/cellobiose transporter subunit IIA [Thermoanaerobacterium sp. DL9XJH110]|uniref:PTS lactose/cellobiose transporter subunit IIA n=1 Tax=Thermoanaerobacterium sp. DL9XJH110 TaxID=3386643 RepID=UPI003BB6BB57
MAIDIEKIAFKIILYAGNAKSEAYKALNEAKQNNFENIEKYMNNAKDELNKAHNVQTELLAEEANGNTIDLPIILVHAQDHLMTAISEINLIKELIDCILQIHKLKNFVSKKL